MTLHKRAGLYLRISTSKQDTDAQRNECTTYALNEGLPIIQTWEDTKSGSTPWRDRNLANMIDTNYQFTDIIVYEYSRIGRDMLDTLEFLKQCNERNINIHIAKAKTVVRADIGGKVISTVMTLAAEIERDLLRSRTKDALAERKRQIKETGSFISKAGNYITSLGRPKGSISGNKLAPKKEEIRNLMKAKVPAAAMARIFDCDRRTVTGMIKLIEAEKT